VTWCGFWEPALQFRFENHVLDLERRELTRGREPIALEPQVFDLLVLVLCAADV
jgi:DNA-binding winged helix-turn-helix (wHTH) protein